MKRIAILLIGLTIVAAAPPTPEQLEVALRDLDADDYQVREKATNVLWSAGTAAEPYLRRGLTSTSAEVVSRSRDLLEKIPYGITPNSPRDLVSLVVRGRVATPDTWPEVMKELMEKGTEGLTIARTLADRQTDSARRASFRRSIDREGWRIASRLIAAGQLNDAEELLSRAAAANGALPLSDFDSLRHYAVFLRITGKLDARLADWQKWSQGLAGWEGFHEDGTPDNIAARAVLLFIAKARGDATTERKLADATTVAEWQEMACFDAGAWSELAERLPDNFEQMSIQNAGMKMLYTRLAGDAKALTEVRQKFAQLSGGKKESEGEAWLYFRLLCFDHRPNDAIALANAAAIPRLKIAAAEMMAQRGQIAEALKALAETPTTGSYALVRLCSLARLAATIGDRAQLKKHLVEIERHLAHLKKEQQIGEFEGSTALDAIDWLLAADQSEAAINIAGAILETPRYEAFEPFAPETSDVFAKLYVHHPMAAVAWYDYLRKTVDKNAGAARLRRLPPLLDRRLAEPAGRKQLDAAIEWAKGRPPGERAKFLRGFAEAAAAAGLTDVADGLLRDAAQDSPYDMQLFRGDRFAEAGKWREAAEAYGQAAAVDWAVPAPLFLHGLALERAGNVPAGRDMQLRARLLPLGVERALPKASELEKSKTREGFCDALGKRVHLDDHIRAIVREERKLIAALSTPASHAGRSALGNLIGDAHAFVDKQQAARANEGFLLRMARTDAYFLRNESYLTVLHRIHAESARAALAQNDIARVMTEARAGHALLPTTYSLAVDLVPALTKLGKTAEADEVYNGVATTLDGILKDHPNSATHAGSRAWLAARCRRDLDRAVTLAKHAVSLTAELPSQYETLAEVHFQKGEKDAAVTVLKDASAKFPLHRYFAKLLARVEAGDNNAPMPER